MKRMPTREQVERIRLQYPPGTQVELISMPEDPRPVPPGTRGEVMAVDDAGLLVMKWSNGRSLSLIPGVDQFRILTEQEIAREQTVTMGGMHL